MCDLSIHQFTNKTLRKYYEMKHSVLNISILRLFVSQPKFSIILE